jgi:hypothetical protein
MVSSKLYDDVVDALPSGRTEEPFDLGILLERVRRRFRVAMQRDPCPYRQPHPGSVRRNMR